MEKHKVYFVHGILGFRREYSKLEKALKREGFETEFFSYNSRKEDLRIVAEKLYRKVQSEDIEKISFVAHSMGGLVVRALYEQMKNDKSFPRIFRIVMIATPNQGAVFAKVMYSSAILRFIMGVNLRHFLADESALARTLPVPDAEIGIIAGYSGKSWGYNPFIGSDNDLEVMPEETKLGSEKDFITVKSNHIAILRNKATLAYVVNFLKAGKF